MAKATKGILSTNALKLIAMAAMVIDHASVIFLGPTSNIFRAIGRISFPIFAFLIAEGAVHTKNKAKYALRLLLFAFLSEIPFDIALQGKYLEFSKQNVFFTLFLGLISIYFLDFFRKKNVGFLGIFTTFGLSFLAAYISSNFGFMGVVVITLMYMFAGVKTDARYVGFALAGLVTCFVYVYPANIALASSQIYASLVFIPLALYNGKKGRKMNKYFFYLFYPAHLLILYLVKTFIV